MVIEFCAGLIGIGVVVYCVALVMDRMAKAANPPAKE